MSTAKAKMVVPSQPVDPRSYRSLGELLNDALIQFKSDLAVVEMHRKAEAQSLSYRQFHQAGLSLAGSLSELNVSSGDRVAIIMTNQPAWLISAFAVFHRGAVLVPIDYKLSPAEQQALLTHAKPKVLITEYPLWRRLDAAPVETVLVSGVPDKAVDDVLTADVTQWEVASSVAEGRPAPTLVSRNREDDACIVYSSGTGGRPKGCVLAHGNYLSQLEGLLETYPLVQGDRYFSILPTNHAIDFMCGFIGPLAGGATVVHQRTLRPEFLIDTMKRQRITHMTVVPLILEAFERSLKERLDEQPPWKSSLVKGLGAINEAITAKRPNHGVSSRLLKPVHDAFGGHLKLLICGGAFVERQRAEYFYRLGLPVVIGYGLTECCTVATVNNLKPFRADSVGSPVKGVTVRVADPGSDGVGEVLIKGPTVMSRYLDDEELTAETIVDGWLHTGDLGVIDASHHLRLVGRSKNMVVTAGGKNIYPEDVEAAFADLDVDELCVLAENYVWSKASMTNERLIAVVKPREGSGSRAVNDLAPKLAALNRRLPEFKRLSGYLLVDDAFPRTASMKIKRHMLAEDLRQAHGQDAVRALS